MFVFLIVMATVAAFNFIGAIVNDADKGSGIVGWLVATILLIALARMQ